jgi:hypothetical protein
MDARYVHFLVEVSMMRYGRDQAFAPQDFKRLLRGFSELLTDASIRRHPRADEIAVFMTERHRCPADAAVAVAAVYEALAETTRLG